MIDTLNNRFCVLLKKDKGFERKNDMICRVLQTDGWSTFRHKDPDYIVISTAKSGHIYKDANAFKNYLLNLFHKGELKELIDQNRLIITQQKH